MATQLNKETLFGQRSEYAEQVSDIYRHFGFDFVSLGLAPFVGAPLRWIYSAGETSNRFRRISLSPGHGIGGIVLKAGKPMMYADIDSELDPREYSSYPIVFAEDLRSFCALPLKKEGRVVGVLLMAFRTADDRHTAAFRGCLSALDGRFCDLDIISKDFLDFESISHYDDSQEAPLEHDSNRSSLSTAIAAQEKERKRISREIHDGIAQELLSVSLMLNRLGCRIEGEEGKGLLKEAVGNIDCILDELHNLSVDLRPSALDHFGLKAALRSQALVYEQTFGAKVEFTGSDIDRFEPARETQVYRICQEAMLNACKYSNADVINIDLEATDEWFQAIIEDHGDGFDVDKPIIRGTGCGLLGMRDRAEILGATLTIASDANGTRITLLAPLYATYHTKEAE